MRTFLRTSAFLFALLAGGCSYGPPNLANVLFLESEYPFTPVAEMGYEQAEPYQVVDESDSRGGRMTYGSVRQYGGATFRYEGLILSAYLSNPFLWQGLGMGWRAGRVYGVGFVNTSLGSIGGGGPRMRFSGQAGVRIFSHAALVFDNYAAFFADQWPLMSAMDDFDRTETRMSRLMLTLASPRRNVAFSPYLILPHNQSPYGLGLSVNLITPIGRSR